MHRIIILSTFLLVATSSLMAQNSYVGLGTGFNNHNGLLGLSLEVGLQESISLRAGAGLGTWGAKLSGGLLVKTGSDKDWKLGVGYSTSSGLKDFKSELEVASGDTQEVLMDLHRVGTLNLSLMKCWESKKGNVFNLEFGYAIPLGGDDYYTVKDGSTLSEASEKVLEIIRPGGLTLAISYMIKISK